MSLKFIDTPSDDDDATLPVVRSDGERKFRDSFKKETGSLRGVDDSYRRSLANQTAREIMGLSRAGRGPVTSRIAAPSAAEINEALQVEVTPADGRRFGRPGIDIPTRYDDDDGQQYQSAPVAIGLSLY